ncbi:MAG TPA: sulfatase-like hydrolase/transferase [Prolixibacteraceae bacterium]|nr:sulfatase-like hydrolase/transferase [Prolixibacteraceae bacterium]
MFNQTIRFFKYFIFWMIFFWLVKAFFLISNFHQSSQLSVVEIAGIFWYGLKMDVSTACYLLLIPGLLLGFVSLLPKRLINSFVWVYTLLFLIIASALVVLDLGLYPHWGTRVNVTAFNYIDDPVAMSASVSVGDVFLGLLIVGGLLACFIYLYKKLFPEGIVSQGKIKWYFLPLQLFLVAALILPIRGGWDTSPLNLSSVAFSPKLYVNQAATNFLWNFGKSVEKRKRLSNPCEYMPKEESVRLFNEFMKPDTLVERPQLITLNPDMPTNVILIILESFSDKVISPLGGMRGIAPNLDSLCTKSTVFFNFYATGNRSDRGISAVLGGYPSLLSTSIMVYPEKARSLTLLPEYFNRKNYHTSFYYGGDINFYNLKTFVLQSNCAKMVTKSDFPSELGRMSKWGVPDSYVFERALKDLKSEKEPFMKTIYTISSHPPFDVPYLKIKGNSIEEKYLNSVSYTDSCLGAFIDEFRKSPLWDNTLLIVTADHGTRDPGPTDITDPASYRIPLIWSGGAVDSIQHIETITMQSDFPTSLVHQLGWQADSSRFGKDFFTSHPHAFYVFDSGWGYVTPEGNYYFDQNRWDFVSKPTNNNLVDLKSAKAYMQVLHDDFIGR